MGRLVEEHDTEALEQLLLLGGLDGAICAALGRHACQRGGWRLQAGGGAAAAAVWLVGSRRRGGYSSAALAARSDPAAVCREAWPGVAAGFHRRFSLWRPGQAVGASQINFSPLNCGLIARQSLLGPHAAQPAVDPNIATPVWASITLPVSGLLPQAQLPRSMLPGRFLPAALRRGLATQASHQASPTLACLEGSRDVIRIAGAGLVNFLQVCRRRRRHQPCSYAACPACPNVRTAPLT